MVVLICVKIGLCTLLSLLFHYINTITSPYAGGVQVGSPEPPFKINDIHSIHVVEVLVLYTSSCTYTHQL